MNRDWFDELLGRLMVLRGAPATIDGHFEVLAAVDPVALDQAVTTALRTRTWFPTPAEVLSDVERVTPVTTWQSTYPSVVLAEARTEVLTTPFGDLRLKVVRDWHYDCPRCTDTGWASWWCGEDTPRRTAWMEPSPCGRTHQHGPHEWVNRCACWATNPTLIRRRTAQSQQAASRTAKTGREGA